MKQLSLFLDDFDLDAAVSKGIEAGSASSEVADLFGFEDDQASPAQLSDGAPAPATEKVTLTAIQDVEAVEVGQFEPVNNTGSETQTEEPAAVIALPIGKPKLVAFEARAEAPWPRMLAEDLADLGGEVGKFDNNIAAIKMVAQLETDSRQPTEEERRVLQRYTGWGGLKNAIDGRPDWAERREVLKSILSESELKTARDSVLNAHYTEVEVVNAVWDIVQQLGFQGGRVIDPSAGTGHFYGAMPQEIAKASDLYAVEIDEMSARIHRALYGHACRMDHSGFEDVDYPSGWFDLAITNVPFGNYPLPCTKRKIYSRWNVHNYFLAKSLDLVRPGGLVAIITSTFTMDAADEKRRAWFRSQAELVAAVRLPAGAFKRMASTDVSADILVFRRREATERPRPQEPEFIALKTLEADKVLGSPVPASSREVNTYWTERPQHVLGRWTGLYSGRYAGYSLQVELPDGKDLKTELAQVTEALPKGIYVPLEAREQEQLIAFEKSEDSAVRNGSLVMHRGLVHRFVQGRMLNEGLSGTREGRARGLITIRDKARELLVAQISPATTDEVLAEKRAELNRLYDQFVDRWGWISSSGNKKVFRTDPDWPLLLALEHYDAEKDVATKAAVFTERTTRPVTMPTTAESPEAAALISMAECGRIDQVLVSHLLGTSEDEAMSKLMESSLVFIDPDTRTYVSREEYLSGNVGQKLAVAKRAGETYERNVAALTEVIPEDIPPGDIETRLGVNWVTPSDYMAFIGHMAGEHAMRYATRMEVVYDGLTGAWTILNRLKDAAFEAKWGTKDINALDLMLESMNGRSATVRDPVYEEKGTKYVVNIEKTAAARERQQLMNEEFQKWLWSDAVRGERLLRHYNDEYNSYVERRYDGSHLRLPGYSWYLALSAHQLNGVARIMTGDNVLLAHVVGAGKTLTMACGSMELRRLGLRQKPLHVVPNHMLEQYAAEFVRAYPLAKLLIARKEDLQKDRRKEFVARVALGNWDAVVMTHSTFERIPASAELTEKLLGDMLDEIRTSLADAKRTKEDRVQVKQLVRLEKLWLAKLEKLKAAWKKDDFFSMADLGVDAILYDEGHLAKNLVRVSQMGRVSGLPNNDSQRAFDLFVKTRQMNAIHGDKERGVVLATGTPVANSMAELHVMQRFLQPQTLRRHNLESFDSWAAMFGRVVTSLEVSPDGATFRMAERFAQFVNLPELMTMFRQVADIQTKEMLNLPTPPLAGGAPRTVVCKPSDELKQYIDVLVKRAEAIRNREVKPDKDNMLSVTNDGRLAALDLRFVQPGAAFDPNGKIASCIGLTYELWKQSEEFRGAQLIFCDAGTPGSTPLDVYAEIKKGLVARGIPEREIAFIHDAKTDAAKALLFKSVREGMTRVLIASTQKGGVGTNVQTRLFALHELDVPWRPCDVEQREGRIERRGNLCEAIHIIRYVTEGSFDAYSWQTLSAKQAFIAQVMAPNTKVRKMQDISMTALSYEEVKAIACGNPLVKEKAQLDTELRRLEMLYSHHTSSVRNAQWEISRQQGMVGDAKKVLAAIDSDAQIVRESGEKLVLGQQAFDGPGEEAYAALAELSQQYAGFSVGEQLIRVGLFAGLNVGIKDHRSRSEGKDVVGISLGNAYAQTDRLYVSGKNVYALLVEMLAQREKDRKALLQRIEACERAIPALQVQMSSPFDKMERMREIRARIDVLEIELGLTKDEAGTEAVDDSTTIKATSAISGVPVDAEEDETVEETAEA